MNQYQIEQRREEIRRLRLMGWKNNRIAEQLGIPIGTLQNDLAIIREEDEKLKENNQKLVEDAAKAVLEMLSKYKLLEKEAWECYLTILRPDEKLKAIIALGKIYQDVAKLLKLLDWNQGGVNIEKYINIENLVPTLNQVIMIIDKYIPDEKKLEAYKELKQLDILKDKKDGQV
jgi:Txe/YoeB family toxin of Txe-Axe toxin-antitoxin module